MAEKAVFYARAVVYYFDPKTKGWTPTAVGSNFCRIDMYENTATTTFRVIGRGLQDTSRVVINSNVTKDTQYTRASETFHQWSDNRYIYGLNFVTKEEAESFGTGFETTVTRLKSGGGSSTPQPPQTPQQTSNPPPAPSPPQAPQAPNPPPAPTPPPAPQAPTPPPAPKAPNPPSAPAPPPAPSVKSGGDGDEPRSALLSSITGFKGGLKKVTTVDKSAPILKDDKSSSGGGGGGKTGGGGMMEEIMKKRQNMASAQQSNNPPPSKAPMSAPPTKQPMKQPSSAPSPQSSTRTSSSSISLPQGSNPVSDHHRTNSTSTSSSSSSTSSPSDLQALKEEILAEMRKELHQMKEEILAAIRNNR